MPDTRKIPASQATREVGIAMPDSQSSVTDRAAAEQAAEEKSRSCAPECQPGKRSEDDTGDRHIENVCAERQNPSVLEDQRLQDENRRHHDHRRSRTQYRAEQGAAGEVRTHARTNRKVEHLRAEEKGSHDPHQRDVPIAHGELTGQEAGTGFGLALELGRRTNTANHPPERGKAQEVQGGPHRGGQESVWDMHFFRK